MYQFNKNNDGLILNVMKSSGLEKIMINVDFLTNNRTPQFITFATK